jgi:hypothetical protein
VAKFLILGGASEGQAVWRLPADVDVAELRNRLRFAIQSGSMESVDCDLGEERSARIIVNGRSIPFVAILEGAEKPSPSRRP